MKFWGIMIFLTTQIQFTIYPLVNWRKQATLICNDFSNPDKDNISGPPKRTSAVLTRTLAALRQARSDTVIYEAVRSQLYKKKKMQSRQDNKQFRSTLIRINFMYFLNLRNLDYLNEWFYLTVWLSSQHMRDSLFILYMIH